MKIVRALAFAAGLALVAYGLLLSGRSALSLLRLTQASGTPPDFVCRYLPDWACVPSGWQLALAFFGGFIVAGIGVGLMEPDHPRWKGRLGGPTLEQAADERFRQLRRQRKEADRKLKLEAAERRIARSSVQAPHSPSDSEPPSP